VLVNAAFATVPAPAKVVSAAMSPANFLSAPTDTAGPGVRPADRHSVTTFGQEQTFNFVEIQPYRE
jgi:hypothetical protein